MLTIFSLVLVINVLKWMSTFKWWFSGEAVDPHRIPLPSQSSQTPNHRMKMRNPFLAIIITTFIFLVGQALAETKPSTMENGSVTPVSARPVDRRPSFWTETANRLKTSTYLSLSRPHANRSLLHRKYPLLKENELKPLSTGLVEEKPRRRRVKVKIEPEQPTEETSGVKAATKTEDLEDRIMKDESFVQLKEFAKHLINETTKYLIKKRNSASRSYPMEELPQSQHQLWDDKDQSYHASSFTNAEYEPTSFHHHYIPPPPPPIHYFPPQKKDDALLAKVALIALLKLILAKLKAIGFLKLMMFFLLKIPVMFFKFLFILKSFKVLKLISIPFLMASFAAPFLPLIPFFAPLLFFPMLFFPLLLPLMLPLLFFLPIVPVTTPVTAAASSRTRRNTSETSDPVSSNWSLMDEKWKAYHTNSTENRARYFRGRPATFENKMLDLDNNMGKLNKVNQYEDVLESTNLIQLTQRVVDAQHCLERVACELANQNDSKIYQAAVIWTLGKVYSLAPNRIKRKIEKYSQAYEIGAKKKSSEYCQHRFHCQRPRIKFGQFSRGWLPPEVVDPSPLSQFEFNLGKLERVHVLFERFPASQKEL